MVKVAAYFSSFACMLVGGASYFAGIPLPFNCKTPVCTIGTTIIGPDLLIFGAGALLFILSTLLLKFKKQR